MCTMKATKLKLATPSQPLVTSLLLEPNSHSLALTHSDTSISLYPTLSLSSPTLLSLSTLIPPPTTSSTFLLLKTKPIFLTSSPHNSLTLLRFFVPNPSHFVKVNTVISTQKDINFDKTLGGILVNVRHGVAVRMYGGVNYFVVHWVSEGRMWVFGVRGEGDEEGALKVMRCAVIECCEVVSSVRVSEFGVLVIGEEGGVRVVGLRGFVRGKGKVREKCVRFSRIDRDGDVSAKLIPFKCTKGSYEGSFYFVPFKHKEIKTSETGKVSLVSLKAISIQPLSPQRFLVLDSGGHVHILCLSDHMINSETKCNMNPLPVAMEVQKLAAIPDTSMTRERQTVWISDGCHSVHMLGLSDMDIAADESITNDCEKLIHISVDQAIFTAEKIQDLVPLAADAILVLGQESLYAYSIS